MDTESAYPVRTTAKAFQVIEGLGELQSAGVTELADHLNLSKSSVYKHLDTLRRLGYVIKEDGTYRLGTRFFQLGNTLRERNELYRIAKPHVHNLTMTTGETASLAVEESGDVVYLYSAHAGSATDTVEGTRATLVADVAGRAILAYKPTSEREAILSNADLPDDESLLEELRTIHDHRLAIERTADEDGQSRVAVPVRDRDNHACGALTVSGSSASLSGKRLEEDITRLLVSAAKRIEVQLRA